VDEARIAWMSARETAAAIRAGDLTSREYLEAMLARIDRLDGPLNLVVTRDDERTRRAADEADREAARGRWRGPLHGVAMTIKDSFQTAGLRTTSGAPELAEFVPEQDAAAVARLRGAGAVIAGKTNLPLYAADVQSYNAVFGQSNNPWDTRRTVGGSSGGAAGALAAGFTPLELGSDIGGSIRGPASCCGVTGHKPSFGIVPGRGQIPGPPGTLTEADIAVAGPLARDVADLALALDVLAGPNEWYAKAWSLDLPPPRPEGEHAHAAQEAPVDATAGEHDPLAGEDAAQQLLRRGVLLGQRRPLPGDMECEERELRRRVQDDAGDGGDALGGCHRQGALLRQRGPEASRAMELQRQPDPQAAEVAGELGTVLAGVVELLVRRGGEVAGGGRVGRPQRVPVAHQQRAVAVGQEQSLVRIEGHRVGAGEAREERAQLGARVEEGAVGPVHVVPEPLLGADVGDGAHRVHGARVHRARRRHREEGTQARRPVGGDGRAERVGPHPVRGVDGDLAHPVGEDARQPRGLRDAQVHLTGDVQHALAQGLPQQPLAGADHGAEVGHRAARRQEPPGRGGHAHPAREPGEHVGLELHEGRRRLPDARVAVRDVGHQVGEGRGEEAAPRDERQVARSRRREGASDPLVEVGAEDLRQRLARLGGLRLAQRTAQVRGVDVAAGGLLVEGRDVGDDAVEHPPPHRGHALGGQLEVGGVVGGRDGRGGHAVSVPDGRGPPPGGAPRRRPPAVELSRRPPARRPPPPLRARSPGPGRS